MIRVVIDPDSKEVTRFIECDVCEGLGGYDASKDCEVYDDWQDCVVCNGKGEVEVNEKGEII